MLSSFLLGGFAVWMIMGLEELAILFLLSFFHSSELDVGIGFHLAWSLHLDGFSVKLIGALTRSELKVDG